MNKSKIEMFRKLLEKDRDNPMILYSLGNELFREERYEEAREFLERALENDPSYSAAYRTLGRVFYELRDDGEADRVFTEGREVAQRNGDLQIVKEIDVFAGRLRKRANGGGSP